MLKPNGVGRGGGRGGLHRQIKFNDFEKYLRKFSAPKAPRRKFWVFLGIFSDFQWFLMSGTGGVGGRGGPHRQKKIKRRFQLSKKISTLCERPPAHCSARATSSVFFVIWYRGAEKVSDLFRIGNDRITWRRFVLYRHEYRSDFNVLRRVGTAWIPSLQRA